MQDPKQHTVPLSLPQRRILLALAEMQEASNVQLCRRWYKAGSIASIWRNIAALERQRRIDHRPRLMRQSADGPAQRLYALTAAGARTVAAMTGQTIIRAHKSGGYIGQEHRYLVNDLWCGLHEWERESSGRVAIVEALHDSAIKRDPLVLALDGKSVRAVPDAWFHLRVDGADRRYWIEADRGTETDEDVFRRKIRVILEAARTQKATAKWGGAGFRCLFVVTPEDRRRTGRRCAQILVWMEKELTARGAKHFGPLFRVAGLDPGAVSGAALFTAPFFVSPFARTAKAAIAP